MPSDEAGVPPPAEPASAPAPTPVPIHTVSVHDQEGAGDSAEGRPTPKTIRSLVSFLSCPFCTRPLLDPVTLPCGRTLCKSCIPKTRQRPNISYPDTPERLLGFPCPFPECGRTHARGDCSIDITFRNVVPRLRESLLGIEGGEAGEAARTNSDTLAEAAGESIEDSAAEAAGQGHQRNSAATSSEAGPEAGPKAKQEGGSLITAQDAAVSNAECDFIDRVQSSARDELCCRICLGLLCDPSTTPCGHTYCWHCLSYALDTVPSCPTCRRSLATMSLSHAATDVTNKALSNIVSALWPAELWARRRSIAAEKEERSKPGVPVFVCTVCFPSMPMMLHVFEQRYRLLVQRALEGDRTFGMVASRRTNDSSDENDFLEVGTMLRIINIEFFPDGRSILETVGLYRFRIRSHTMVDGYIMAETERIDDISIVNEEDHEAREIEAARRRLPQYSHAKDEAGEAPIEEEDDGEEEVDDEDGGDEDDEDEDDEDDGEEDLGDEPEGEGASLSRQTTSTSATLTVEPETVRLTEKSTAADLDAASTRELIRFVEVHLKERPERSMEWLTNRLIAIYGEQPQDPAVLPWWFASIYPLRPEERYRLLEATSVRERIKMCCAWIIEMHHAEGLHPPAPRSDRRRASCTIL